jgi:sn-glycerol 3-phosphate transport system substrate-binding protein
VNTGYFPIRKDVIGALEGEGFYAANPNARVAVDQLLAAPDSAAAKGALAGVFPELREHVENAMEEALGGKDGSGPALERAQLKSIRALQRYRKLL